MIAAVKYRSLCLRRQCAPRETPRARKGKRTFTEQNLSCSQHDWELASGKLVQAIPDHAPPEPSINAVYETRRHLLPKLQAFLGFLKERFGTKA